MGDNNLNNPHIHNINQKNNNKPRGIHYHLAILKHKQKNDLI